MFHGLPYCTWCDYEGPEFMWTWHHGFGIGILIQDWKTFDLRAIDVPDDNAFYYFDGKSSDDVRRESERYIEEFVRPLLGPRERRVPIMEFARFGEPDEPGATELPCPRCRQFLRWRDTGIS